MSQKYIFLLVVWDEDVISRDNDNHAILDFKVFVQDIIPNYSQINFS